MRGRSSVSPVAPAPELRRVRRDGTPVYGYPESPGLPSVTLRHTSVGEQLAPREHRHAHDFHVLLYAEHSPGQLRVDDHRVDLPAGGLYGVRPGQVVDAGALHDHGDTWTLAFTPAVVPALATLSPLAWSLHPLLALFSDDAGALVPRDDRGRWQGWLTAIEQELRAPDHLSPEAVGALVSSVLVASARLVPPPSVTLDPLVERVFETIETGYASGITAGEVARRLGYTPGHLTTVLRERTGRTLLAWIVERRLTEARRLLRDTDLPLGAIADRTGLGDAGYLIRRFRRRYGVTPERWRRG